MSAAATPTITTITTPTTIMGNSGTEGEGFVEPKMFVSIMLYEIVVTTGWGQCLSGCLSG